MATIHPWSSSKLASGDSGLLPQRLQILVRDPPREQLPADPAHFAEKSAFLVSQFPGQFNATSSTQTITHPGQLQDSFLIPSHRRVMAKRRLSLQSIFIPSLLNSLPSPTEAAFPSSTIGWFPPDSTIHSSASDNYKPSRVTSSRDSPPPDFLLDDDPFANLSAAPTIFYSVPLPPPPPIPTTSLDAPPKQPRSPLTPNTPDHKPSFLSSPPPISPKSPTGISRTLSGRVRPAYQKPAFGPRPSLPSLDTLARMNVVLTKKVRKGRVGAKLPFEPWDQLDKEQTSGDSSGSQSPVENSPPSTPSASLDFVSNLELDFRDFEEDDDSTMISRLPTFTPVSQTSPISQDELSYCADCETSVDDESMTTFSQTSSELSPLTRSASTSSNSSIGSPEYQWQSFTSHNSSMSSAEDSDTPNSPPDDYASDSRFDPHTLISSYWSSEDLYDSLNGNVTTSALYTDVNLLSELDMVNEPGTSAGTIRPPMAMVSKPSNRSISPAPTSPDEGETFDGAEEEDRYRSGSVTGWEQGAGSGRRANGNNPNGSGREGGSGINRLGGRGDDEDEDDKRGRVNRSAFSSSESDASTSDDADEDSTDDYGDPVVPAAHTIGSSASSDDDVPLAQRIPSALKAQNTIRRQVREEREERRAARAAKAAQSASSSQRQPPAPPPGAGSHSQVGPMSSSQEAALHASRSVRRPRIKTLPSSEMQPFCPEDLTRKLQNMEVTTPIPSVPMPTHHRSRSNTTSRRDYPDKSANRPASAGRGVREPVGFQSFASPPQSPPPEHRSLRPMRSFHRPEGRKLDEHHAVPLPADAGQKLARNLTTRRDEPSSSSPRSYPNRISQDEALSRQPTTRRSGEEPRKLIKQPETRSTRSSSEIERHPRANLQRPPVPPLPSSEALASASHAAKGPVTQQRIFIGDMQRFNMVEIGATTNAGDVIEMIDAQGSLKGWVGSGGWMVWEIAQDFGMERPIRSFELLSDVQASWNKDKLLNTFVLRLTPLAVPLSRSAIPSASPTYAGYVEWESKRGKWNKRWLQLREHSLWLSKRDNGRDEVLLCSLSNFDAYFITRLHKAPRPFSFAVKSTDKLSFFENTADYLHIFSCSEKEGNHWIEKILLARSYVLHQEKHVLFNPKATSSSSAPGGPGSLSRSGTRKASSAHRPPQPLLSVAPPMTIAQQMQSIDVFEPGSLLRKHA